MIGVQLSEFYQMTPWEFVSCIEGYNRAHSGPEKPLPPTEEEFDEMLRTLH